MLLLFSTAAPLGLAAADEFSNRAEEDDEEEGEEADEDDEGGGKDGRPSRSIASSVEEAGNETEDSIPRFTL